MRAKSISGGSHHRVRDIPDHRIRYHLIYGAIQINVFVCVRIRVRVYVNSEHPHQDNIRGIFLFVFVTCHDSIFFLENFS